MKTISLTQGKEAIVDDVDYEWLSQWRWRYQQPKGKQTQYARREVYVGGKRKPVLMHRVIAEQMGLLIDGKQIDHIDGNGLNNRQNNLRLATNSQNHANTKKPITNTSGFKGVSWHRRCNKWAASICIAKHSYHLGYFDNPVEAARTYNKAAVKFFGEYACTIAV